MLYSCLWGSQESRTKEDNAVDFGTLKLQNQENGELRFEVREREKFGFVKILDCSWL